MEYSFYILSGGKSVRMGEDKGMVKLSGKPMVEQLLEKLISIGSRIKIITSNQDYKQFGFPILPDVVFQKGPMGGLLTALQDSLTTNIFILGCDMPLIPIQAFLQMIKSHQEGNVTVASIGGIPNPLFCIYPKFLSSSVQQHISEGKLKMIDFIKGNRHQVIAMENLPEFDASLFRNFNFKKDLE